MNWIEIFRTGTWTDSAGKTRTWTTADLDRIVATYDPAKREAPLVIGHPKDNAPAYGWVDGVKRAGERLHAQFKQVPDQVKNLVAQGRYKKRSISIYPDGSLRHVGLLGAVPPAVPGLKDIGSFGNNGDPSTCYEFEESQETKEANRMDPLKILQEENERLKAELDKLKAAQKGNEFAGQITALEATVKDLGAKLDAANKEKDEAAKSFSESQKAARAKDLEARVDALMKGDEPKLLPSEKKAVMAFLERLDGETTQYEFSEGQGKKPLVDHFFDLLERRDSHGLFRSFSAPTGKEDGGAIDYSKIMNKV